DKAAVLAEDPVAEVPGEFDGLLAGVVREGGAVLDDFGGVRKGGKVAQLDGQVAEDLENLFAFLAVARADDEDGRHGGSVENRSQLCPAWGLTGIVPCGSAAGHYA